MATVLYQMEQSTEFAQSTDTTLHKRVLNFLGTLHLKAMHPQTVSGY